ncbi:MAG: cation:proton antiporter, partial [Leptolyngbyaceae cyanobacterium]
LMVSEVDYSEQALGRVLPLRDTFACLFYASVGKLIAPQVQISNGVVILGLVTLVMIGKALIILPIILRFGYSFKTALLDSVGLHLIGEFSFVLSLQGVDLGLISEQLYLLLLGTTAVALVLTPAWLSSARCSPAGYAGCLTSANGRSACQNRCYCLFPIICLTM